MPEQENKLEIPFPIPGEKRVLVHSCCAPCSGGILQSLKNSGLECTLYFYNPNIQPKEEYELRKQEEIRFAEKIGIPFADADYDPENWLVHVKGLENEPERGRRCRVCFELRLNQCASFAHKNNFKVFTSSLGISRYKDMDLVNTCGLKAASLYPGLTYWTFNWRKKGGSQLADHIAEEEHFYRQNYCGCVFSQIERAKKCPPQA